MTIPPSDLKRVGPDLFNTFQIVFAGHVRETLWFVGFQKNGFSLAASARAGVAQPYERNGTLMSVGPLNGKIAVGGALDLFRCYQAFLKKKGQSR
jgi:hypothetical protein